MVNWLLHTGVYLLGIALIPAVGLLLVCWGLWGDRSKGRARCPHCWYDMRGSLPKIECPECGHDPKARRQLYKNHRRWRPFALGIVLVLVSCYPLTIIVGWYREQVAIRDLSKRGHTISQTRIGPAWLVYRLPDDPARFFKRVSYVELAPGTTDVRLVQRKKLSRLRGISLPGTQVANDGLVHLKELSKLHLSETQVTDARLAHLKEMSCLSELYLGGTQVTDAGLVHLKGLSQLRVLILNKTQVTDVGLVHLEGLTQFEFLILAGTQVTDAGLVHLKGMSQLNSLHLSRTQVTDAGVAKLTQALSGLHVMRLP